MEEVLFQIHNVLFLAESPVVGTRQTTTRDEGWFIVVQRIRGEDR